MTTQEMNRAINEAVGWLPERDEQTGGRCYVPDEAWPYPDSHDFCHDLNAMHDVVALLGDKERAEYCDTLVQVADADVDYKTVEATAIQRAEAFLKTIDRWVPNPAFVH